MSAPPNTDNNLARFESRWILDVVVGIVTICAIIALFVFAGLGVR